jgi:hypothetical protein
MRLAPSRHIVGIDMHAALSLASAREHDLAVLSELLPAAEAGFVEASCARKGDPDRGFIGSTNVLGDRIWGKSLRPPLSG